MQKRCAYVCYDWGGCHGAGDLFQHVSFRGEKGVIGAVGALQEPHQHGDGGISLSSRALGHAGLGLSWCVWDFSNRDYTLVVDKVARKVGRVIESWGLSIPSTTVSMEVLRETKIRGKRWVHRASTMRLMPCSSPPGFCSTSRITQSTHTHRMLL